MINIALHWTMTMIIRPFQTSYQETYWSHKHSLPLVFCESMSYCPLHLADLSRWVWYWCIKGNCLIIRFRVQVQQYGKATNIENISPDPSWTIDSGCDLIEGVLLLCRVGTRAILLIWKALTLTMSCSPLSNLQQQRDDKNTWGRKPRTPKTSFLLGIAYIIPPAPCNQFWQLFSVLKNIYFGQGVPLI